MACSRAVKMPVHSRAISIPSSFQGRSAGLRSAKTFMGPRPTFMLDFVDLTLTGKGPWILSYCRSNALASTEPRSLIATTSMSLRPLSIIPRKTSRPMRPKPLMATRTVMIFPPELIFNSSRYFRLMVLLFYRCGLGKRCRCCAYNCVSCNAKVSIKGFCWRTGTE